MIVTVIIAVIVAVVSVSVGILTVVVAVDVADVVAVVTVAVTGKLSQRQEWSDDTYSRLHESKVERFDIGAQKSLLNETPIR